MLVCLRVGAIVALIRVVVRIRGEYGLAGTWSRLNSGVLETIMDNPTDIREDENELLFGVILPLLLVTLVIANVLTRRAWIPAGRGSGAFLVQSVEHPSVVTGMVMLEIALAAGLFAWYWLANRPRFDRYVFSIKMGSIGVAMVGLGLLLSALLA